MAGSSGTLAGSALRFRWSAIWASGVPARPKISSVSELEGRPGSELRPKPLIRKRAASLGDTPNTPSRCRPIARVVQVDALLAGEPVPLLARKPRGRKSDGSKSAQPTEVTKQAAAPDRAAPPQPAQPAPSATKLADVRRRFKLTQQEIIAQLAEAGDVSLPSRRAYCDWETSKRPMPQWAQDALADLQQNGIRSQG
jgi:hypothetical protein